MNQKRKQRDRATARRTKQIAAPESSERNPEEEFRWYREAVESFVVAIILAFLFRAFEAEAFVIPTGSMAPTLRGRHLNVACEQCGYWHQVGDSVDEVAREGIITYTLCPMCFFPNETVDLGIRQPTSLHPDQMGDRILVNKFAYDYSDPARWDVIVFKYPGNAKQNFIKRLIGLPEETLRIQDGDIFSKSKEDSEFSIERRHPEKLAAMLQAVHDTRYIPDLLVEHGWPPRWQPTSGDAWKVEDGGRTVRFDEQSEISWMSYRHLVPEPEDWKDVLDGGEISTEEAALLRPHLITDFYGYNAKTHNAIASPPVTGSHWVGDLSVHCDLEIQAGDGALYFELIESGVRFTCTIDISTGEATLSVEGGDVRFDASADQSPTAQTEVQGAGKFRVRFANVDDALHLWVNGKPVPFSAPATYTRNPSQRPHWTPEDAGDLQPIRLGVRGVRGLFTRLRVDRDIYYVATQTAQLAGIGETYNVIWEYRADAARANLNRLSTWIQMRNNLPSMPGVILADYFCFPEVWREGDLFDSRATVEFELDQDQFFPLGDNSPSSKDGRLWEGEHSVSRELLIGKAFVIYWPHGRIPGFPNSRQFNRLPLPPDLPRIELIR